MLRSIQEADKIIETGCRPVIITCDDYKDYVCKYNRGVGMATTLLCEFLGSQFAKLWSLNHPDFDCIKIERSHIPQSFNLNSYYFDKTCFGTMYLRNLEAISLFNEEIFKNGLKKNPETNLLKIGLFDLWLSNEDRHQSNYNLLYDAQSKLFVPIDHDKILNSRILNQEIELLTEEDSLLRSPLMVLFTSDYKFPTKFKSEYRNYFYFCIDNCHKNLSKIYNEIPTDWNINEMTFYQKMDELFSGEWLNNVYNSFLAYLQYNIID